VHVWPALPAAAPLRASLPLLLVVVAAAGALAACVADGTPEDTSPLTEGGPAPRFGDTACATCISGRCDAEVQACAREPVCAGAVRCESECPALPNGTVDPVCAAACPSPAAGWDSEPLEDLRACASRVVARCAPCGAITDEAGGAGDGATDGAASGDSGRPNLILGQSCAPPDAGDACERCKESHCCETRAACQNDAECNAFADCMEACIDGEGLGYAECAGRCDATHPAGYAPYEAQVTCTQVFCAVECLGAPPSPCLACTFDECRVPLTSCQANVECARLTNCVELCRTGACRQGCITSHPDGEAHASALAACGDVRCAETCL
jgi:hypothetical protein